MLLYEMERQRYDLRWQYESPRESIRRRGCNPVRCTDHGRKYGRIQAGSDSNIKRTSANDTDCDEWRKE